jgi:hypothetical protein
LQKNLKSNFTHPSGFEKQIPRPALGAIPLKEVIDSAEVNRQIAAFKTDNIVLGKDKSTFAYRSDTTVRTPPKPHKINKLAQQDSHFSLGTDSVVLQSDNHDRFRTISAVYESTDKSQLNKIKHGTSIVIGSSLGRTGDSSMKQDYLKYSNSNITKPTQGAI